MKSKTIDTLVADALAIEAEDAREAGALGFMARVLVQATMPHARTDALHHERTNGELHLTMIASPKRGLPYGATPRLLLAWLATEAVRTRDRHLVLGDNLSAFMAQLDMVPTGGRWGSITRLRDQSRRLFGCTVEAEYTSAGATAARRFLLTDRDDTWWSPIADQGTLWQSTVTLSESFFEEVTAHPVPIDLRALKALRRSPLALDLYAWTTYRMSTIRRPTTIPWASLAAQFGAGYPDTPRGLRNFRAALRHHLRAVLVVYPDADVEATEGGLLLCPSPTHVPRVAGRSRAVDKG